MDPSLSLEDFEGEPRHLGLDLPSRTDLQGWHWSFRAGIREAGRTTYAAFARCYLDEAAVREARNPSYPDWAAAGHLVVTRGNETDFDTIESDIRELCSRFHVLSAAYDPRQAAQMSQRLYSGGLPMIEFRTTTQNFSPAIVELDAAMRAGRLRHYGNPVLQWCLSNIVGKADRRGNLYPTKRRQDQNIDGAIALTTAIGRAMAMENNANIDSFQSNPLSF